MNLRKTKMPTQTFKPEIGQRVRFIKDNPYGGAVYGKAGYSKKRVIVLLDNSQCAPYNPFVLISNLMPETPEDTFDKDGVE
jgi:hypothetical protein